jgi:hypothetical protein
LEQRRLGIALAVGYLLVIIAALIFAREQRIVLMVLGLIGIAGGSLMARLMR